MQRIDRSAGRVTKLGHDEEDNTKPLNETPAERIGQVWEVTRSVWSMVEPNNAPSRLSRHVGRIVRPQR